jgi:quinol monooxygenase YgiN
VHARVNTARVEPGQIDEFAAVANALLPRAKPQAQGLNSALVLGDRHTGKIVIVSNWDSEAAGDAAEPMYQQAMREFGRFLAEPPARERYEVLLEM